MGRKVQSWRWVLPAMDMDDVHNVLIPVRVACSACVSGSASCAIESWDLEVYTSLCPWRFMIGRILLQVLGRQARQMSLSCSLLESGDRAGLLVSFSEGMICVYVKDVY